MFNFPLMESERLTVESVRANQRLRLTDLPDGAWPANTLGNHDESRLRSRLADGKPDEILCQLAAALMLTLRGTPLLYYGEEIGMADLSIRSLSEATDPTGILLYESAVSVLGMGLATASTIGVGGARDKQRSPMQWSGTANAGFGPDQVRPWLPVHPNHAEGVNVEDQSRDPDSLLALYRRLTGFAGRHPRSAPAGMSRCIWTPMVISPSCGSYRMGTPRLSC